MEQAPRICFLSGVLKDHCGGRRCVLHLCISIGSGSSRANSLFYRLKNENKIKIDEF